MYHRWFHCFVLSLISVTFLPAANPILVTSPNQLIHFEFNLIHGSPDYTITYQNRTLIEHSPLSVEFADGPFGLNLQTGPIEEKEIKETYPLITGKNKWIESHFRQITIPLIETHPPYRHINLVVRAFDDGVAFRWDFPASETKKAFTIYEEKTTFNITGNPQVLTMYLANYQTSHEGLYSQVTYQELEEKHLMEMPTLFEYPDGVYLAITEASVRDYAGMYLWKEGGMLQGKLSPLPGQEHIKVEASLPHRSPWRVFMISDRIGALIESNILTNLNDSCKILDTSWINPGKTTFTWWNGNMVPDTNFAPGNNFATNKYYIDFAASHGLQYHAIYGYAEQPWYMDDGFDFGTPGEHVDVTKAIKSLDIQAICDYAHEQGIGVYVWVNWKALYPQLDDALTQYQAWGLSGIMVDFMDRDDQEMINIQEEILAKSAQHHLFVQFHGASKPSGLHRTYPNEFTREGTLNYEVYKWANSVNADHDINIPFTRLLAGATDYHLGGFRAVPREKYQVHYSHPLVTSTRCHMLAMYVVLESYLAMVCDVPEAYADQPGFEFIQMVPTTWDETKVPLASMNEFITVARKKDDIWYVGILNNGTARHLDIPMNFLEDGSFIATIYRDEEDATINPNHLIQEEMMVTQKDRITIPLAPDGGAVMWLRKAKE